MNVYLFIVHKREVIKWSAGRIRGALVIYMFDKFEGFFVSVDEGEGIVLWINCQELKPKQWWWYSIAHTCTITLYTVIHTHLLILFISNVTREAPKLGLPVCERKFWIRLIESAFSSFSSTEQQITYLYTVHTYSLRLKR